MITFLIFSTDNTVNDSKNSESDGFLTENGALKILDRELSRLTAAFFKASF